MLLVKSGYLAGRRVGGVLRDLEARVGKEEYSN